MTKPITRQYNIPITVVTNAYGNDNLKTKSWRKTSTVHIPFIIFNLLPTIISKFMNNLHVFILIKVMLLTNYILCVRIITEIRH